MRATHYVLILIGLLFALAGCGSDVAQQASASSPERPVVVATTSILGDVLENLAGDQFNVITIMPAGVDPHDFQPSAQDVAAIEDASAIILNGADFEEGLLDAIEAAQADGVNVFEAIAAVATLTSDSADHHDHDDDHDDDDDNSDHDDDHDDDDDNSDHDGDGHDDDDKHEGVDPHFFTDPARMAVAADGIADFLIDNVDGVDAEALRAQADRYVSALESLDSEVEMALAAIPTSQRVLVTNHQVFSYFADRYGFEVIGTVSPVGSGAEGVSGQRLADLAELLEQEGVSAVFTDESAPDELARTLASEVGDVAVIELFSESLGGQESEGATYIDMVRTNAARIVDGLAG